MGAVLKLRPAPEPFYPLGWPEGVQKAAKAPPPNAHVLALLQAALRAPLVNAQAKLSLEKLQEALQKGDAALVTDDPVWAESWEAAEEKLEESLGKLVHAAGAVEALRLSGKVRFDLDNPWATAYAKRQTATLVTRVDGETKKTIRAVVARGFGEGKENLTPQKIARELRPHIGLNGPQSRALAAMRARLAGDGTPWEEAEAKLLAYSAKLIRRRAELIARTEIITAENRGHQAAWLSAREQGYVPDESVRVWIAAASSGRTCPACLRMHGLQAPLDGPFVSPDFGEVDGPTLHPACRCGEGLWTPVPKEPGWFEDPDLPEPSLLPPVAPLSADKLAALPPPKPRKLLPAPAAAEVLEDASAGGLPEVPLLPSIADSATFPPNVPDLPPGPPVPSSAPAPTEPSEFVQPREDALEGVNVVAVKLGAQAGSNPGGFYLGSDGVERYVKFYADAAQAECEALSNRIYRDLGLGAPKSYVVDVKGKRAHAAELLKGKTIGSSPTEEQARAAMEGFPADVLLGNWDAVGMGGDNVLLQEDTGKAARIDTGGSLLFRAQGTRKPAAALQNVTEWSSFFDPATAPDYSRTAKLAGAKKAEDLPGVKDGIKKVLALRDSSGGWDAYVKAHAPGLSEKDREDVVGMLEARTDFLEGKRKKMELPLPVSPPASAPHAEATILPTPAPSAPALPKAPKQEPLWGKGNNKSKNVKHAHVLEPDAKGWYYHPSSGQWVKGAKDPIFGDGKVPLPPPPAWAPTKKPKKEKVDVSPFIEDVAFPEPTADMLPPAAPALPPAASVLPTPTPSDPAKPPEPPAQYFGTADQKEKQFSHVLKPTPNGSWWHPSTGSWKKEPDPIFGPGGKHAAPKPAPAPAEEKPNPFLHPTIAPPPSTPHPVPEGMIVPSARKAGPFPAPSRYHTSTPPDFDNATEVKSAAQYEVENLKQWPPHNKVLSEDEKRALREYTGSAFTPTNNALRGDASPSPGTLRRIELIDAAFAKAPALKNDLHVYRGWSSFGDIPAISHVPPSSLVGKVFLEDGYGSSSPLKERAWGKDVMLDIRVPKGIRVSYAEHYTSSFGEKEVLLPRGYGYKILKAEKDMKTGRLWLHVEMVKE